MPTDLNLLADRMFEHGSARPIELAPGEVLIAEGDGADTVYVLLTGTLEVAKRVGDDDAILAVVDQPGDLIGEMVSLSGGTRTASVTARSASELVAISADDFAEVLNQYPELTPALVAMSTRRADEAELAQLLAKHFGIVDEISLIDACGAVTWRRLSRGETLMREGDVSDTAYFVIRGRLAGTRRDVSNSEDVSTGEIGRGGVVGEIGILAGSPRDSTVTALRDSVVAEMSGDSFLDLLGRQPRMAIDLSIRAVERVRDPKESRPRTTAIGVIGANPGEAEGVAADLARELGRFGETIRISPQVVDNMLGIPGISGAGRGELEDVRVSRLIHELELAADLHVVELGSSPGAWSDRAMGLVDRLLIVTSPHPSPEEFDIVERQLGASSTFIRRTVVITHPTSETPSGSSDLRKRFGAEDVIHVVRHSDSDMGRLARIVTGRGNALILGGGGARGFAHIGAHRVLSEGGFPIDLVGGTSIGGVIASVIADGMEPDDIVDWSRSHFPKILDYTLPIVSLTKARRITSALHSVFGEREIEDLVRTYFALSTDLTRSQPFIHDRGPISTAIRATSAIPGVMPPVPLGDALLVDGGVLNNLPLDVAREKSPFGKIVAVDVAPPRGPGAHGDYGLAVNGWDALRANWGREPSPYPRISAVLMRSMITASMRERDTQVRTGLADCYIDVDMRGISMLDFSDPGGVAQRGYEAARPQLAAWLEST